MSRLESGSMMVAFLRQSCWNTGTVSQAKGGSGGGAALQIVTTRARRTNKYFMVSTGRMKVSVNTTYSDRIAEAFDADASQPPVCVRRSANSWQLVSDYRTKAGMGSLQRLILLCVCLGSTSHVHGLPYPLPAHMQIESGPSLQLAPDLSIAATGEQSDILSSIMDLYTQVFRVKTSANPPQSACPSASSVARIEVQVLTADSVLGPRTDESYEVAVNGTVAHVTAASPYGARHALETFAQLVVEDAAVTNLTSVCGHAGWLLSTPIYIKDAPSYPYRGLMIDTSRHFLPIHMLKHTVDGLAALRLNVLHIHLTDSTR